MLKQAEVAQLVHTRRDYRHRQAVLRLESEKVMVREAIQHAQDAGEAFTVAGALRFLGQRWTASTKRFCYFLSQVRPPERLVQLPTDL